MNLLAEDIPAADGPDFCFAIWADEAAGGYWYELAAVRDELEGRYLGAKYIDPRHVGRFPTGFVGPAVRLLNSAVESHGPLWPGPDYDAIDPRLRDLTKQGITTARSLCNRS